MKTCENNFHGKKARDWRAPPPGKYRYAVESVKPSHRITMSLAHHRVVNENFLKKKGEKGRVNAVYLILDFSFYHRQEAFLCAGPLWLKSGTICFELVVVPRIAGGKSLKKLHSITLSWEDCMEILNFCVV